SPDDTPSVARELAASDARVRYHRQPANGGLPRNINAGLPLARGEFIWLISADDQLADDGAVARAAAVFQHHPDVGTVWSAARRLGGAEERLPNFDHGDAELHLAAGEFAARIWEWNTICAPGAVARRACYTELGPEPFPVVLPFIGDWYLWFRFGLTRPAHYLPQPLAQYREHGENMTATFAGGRAERYYRERAIFHLWMQQLGPRHAKIVRGARAALERYLADKIQAWAWERDVAA